MRRRIPLALLAASSVAATGACGAAEPEERPRAPAVRPAPVSPATGAAVTLRSRALGRPTEGRLVNGVQLPESGPGWVSWDPILRRVPNRPSRRWATDALLAFLVGVIDEYRLAHPDAPPLLVGDLSLPAGGVFDERYGGLGHASHQNGLDADIYYPRRDRALRAARRPADVDRRLAQDLVDRVAAAGARFAFVGLRVGLTGPSKVVQAIPHHDDHVHVRIRDPRRRYDR